MQLALHGVDFTSAPSRRKPVTVASGRIESAALREACIADPAADRLDAVLCLAQAAWGWQRRSRPYGLPEEVDPVEGWIVSVPVDADRTT